MAEKRKADELAGPQSLADRIRQRRQAQEEAITRILNPDHTIGRTPPKGYDPEDKKNNK